VKTLPARDRREVRGGTIDALVTGIVPCVEERIEGNAEVRERARTSTIGRAKMAASVA